MLSARNKKNNARAKRIASSAAHVKGFTLIEVLVALVIVSMISGGVLSLISQNTRLLVLSEERLLASVLADNIMVERLATRSPLNPGTKVYEIAFAGQQWRCEELIVRTNAGDLMRVDLAISLANSQQTLASVTTLKAPR